MNIDILTISAQLGFGLQCGRDEKNEIARRIRPAVVADLRERLSDDGRFWTNREINTSVRNAIMERLVRCEELERILAEK